MCSINSVEPLPPGPTTKTSKLTGNSPSRISLLLVREALKPLSCLRKRHTLTVDKTSNSSMAAPALVYLLNMVLISHPNKFIFVKTKKSASTSIEECLEYYLIGVPSAGFGEASPERISFDSYVSARGRVKVPNFMAPHISTRELVRLLGAERLASYRKVSCVRNPWDQVVSFFWWRLRRHPYWISVASTAPIMILKLWFSIWYFTNTAKIKNLSFTQQLSLNGELPPFHIIRYESAEADLKELLKALGHSTKDIYLPRRKSNIRSRPEPFQKYYFNFVRNSVSRIRRQDLAKFGYQWEKEQIES